MLLSPVLLYIDFGIEEVYFIVIVSKLQVLKSYVLHDNLGESGGSGSKLGGHLDFSVKIFADSWLW